MSEKLLVPLVAGIAVAILVSGVSAAGGDAVPISSLRAPARVPQAGAREETLWIFDADFEDLTGDNAGWTTYDRSGTIAQTNHWHHDTIRINGFSHLGDSTWWCGTYNHCWCQARGYGNDWLQILERHFTEAADSTGVMTLEYDQRYAMERNYDYGYVDIRSPAHPDSWATIVVVHNPGFMGTAGISQDWDSTNPQGPGHMIINISDYVGGWFDLRFRFESDRMVSSQDSYDDPPASPFLDGAWQIDNITLVVNGDTVYHDDAESSGDNGWVHDDVVASGQTGVTFWRGQYGIDFVTGRGFVCDDRPVGSWMYAAVDPFTSAMVDGEYAWLMSPPIDVSGAARLVGQWDGWSDTGGVTGDIFNLLLASNDAHDCVTDPSGFFDEEPGCWHTPHYQWWLLTDDWDAYVGSDWLAILWALWNSEPAEEPHMGGIFLNRQRVGVPSGAPGTKWEVHSWRRFNDWFVEDLAGALAEEAAVKITDRDGISLAYLEASNDGGQTWEAYEMHPESAGSDWWMAPPPVNQITPASEILYYYEATDSMGHVSTFPSAAPDRVFEMSILPIEASVTNPGIHLVDKFGGGTPGAMRSRPPFLLEPLDPAIDVELYYREMLEALGHAYDVYDVDGNGAASNGPDTTGMKYYDTQIWITSFLYDVLESATITPIDQLSLIQWLNESEEGKERNLLLTGNNIGKELVEDGGGTLGFYGTWLATDYLDDAVGVVTVDSVPGLEEHAGGSPFMTHDGGECIVRGACPMLHNFDVIEPAAGVVGAEVVADYVPMDETRRSAGVAYTHQIMGYQTVNLGFGMEFMMDGVADGGSANYTPEGYYHNGIADRVDLMQNIMDYFGKTPSGPGTGVVDGSRQNVFSHAYPNPFNPATTISYAVKGAGTTTIRIYNVAGEVVRTLLEDELRAGTIGHVTWDGANDAGETCASGVYFCRISAPGFASSKKMVLLR
jgi:hypothetical protein